VEFLEVVTEGEGLVSCHGIGREGGREGGGEGGREDQNTPNTHLQFGVEFLQVITEGEGLVSCHGVGSA